MLEVPRVFLVYQHSVCLMFVDGNFISSTRKIYYKERLFVVNVIIKIFLILSTAYLYTLHIIIMFSFFQAFLIKVKPPLHFNVLFVAVSQAGIYDAYLTTLPHCVSVRYKGVCHLLLSVTDDFISRWVNTFLLKEKVVPRSF